MKTLLCTLTMAALCAVAATAGTVTISLDNTNQSGAAGADIEFTGTITNTGIGTVYLNGDGNTLGGGGDLFFDDTPFFNGPASLAPNTSTGDIELFDVVVSDSLANGFATYAADWNVQGGTDLDDSQDTLATVAFSVTTTPEPSTAWLLLGGGLAAVFPVVRRRYFA